MARVNRLISAWPTDAGDDSAPLMDSFESVKTTFKKLNAGLTEVKSVAEAETR